jgi:hypothetical protein
LLLNLIRDLLTRLEFKGKDRQADLPDPEVVFNFRQNAISNGALVRLRDREDRGLTFICKNGACAHFPSHCLLKAAARGEHD